MAWMFSKETGFIPAETGEQKAGMVTLSDEVYSALFVAQAKGAVIGLSSVGEMQAVDGLGDIIDLKTVGTAITYAKPYTPTLADKATVALNSGKAFTKSEYTDFGDVIPDNWKSYLKALRDISDGTDTTSTALPAQPA